MSRPNRTTPHPTACPSRRRNRWTALSGLCTVLLVPLFAIPAALPAQTAAGSTPRLLFQTADGVAAFDVQRGASSVWATDARPSGDSSVLVSAIPDGARSVVRVIDTAEGVEQQQFTIDSPARVRVVSFRGDRVALSPDEPTRDGEQPGRERTTLVVAQTSGTGIRTYDLPGNIEPEAFSTDGQALFVIEYLPPLQPDRYQVRRLDLTTGTIGEVASPDGATQGQMPGVARTQVMAPDGSRLYTLYTSSHGGGHDYSFVHVLDLEEQWAHCVDLPRPFGRTPDALGLTVTPDGGDVFVADVAAGRLAAVPTDRLVVDRVGRLAVRGRQGQPHLAASDSLVYVGADRALVAVHRTSLVLRYHSSMSSPVRGLVLPTESSMLYVAHRRSLDGLDAVTGTVAMELPVELPGLVGVGATSVPVDGSTVKCAC